MTDLAPKSAPVSYSVVAAAPPADEAEGLSIAGGAACVWEN